MTRIKAVAPIVVKIDQMRPFIFKCPHTGLNVQHRLDDEAPSAGPGAAYETVVCPACTRLHFVNKSTGRLLGERDT